MPNPENANYPIRTWNFAETALVGLIAYVIYGLTFGLASYNTVSASPAVQYQAYGAALILAGLLPIAVLWIVIRLAHRDFGEYLALNWPSSDEALRAVLITTSVMVIQVVAFSVVGPTETSPNPYLRAGWGLLTFLIAGCIVVPVMEEFVVRGFVFRGWSHSFLGPAGAILLSSILWALVHTQYNWFGQFWIFVTGLALGYIRWRSNSIWLTVMLHSALNTIVFFGMRLQP